MCFNVIKSLCQPSCKMCYPFLLLVSLISFRASAIQYAGVGGYGHAALILATCRLHSTTGTSESAVKKKLNKLCHGSCDAMAITAQGDVKQCGAVGLKLNPWYAHSATGYGITRKKAIKEVASKLKYNRILSTCVPAAMDYQLSFGAQSLDSHFPKPVEQNFPSLTSYLKDKDNHWKHTITAAISGDSKHPSRYYFFLENKTYIWFDDKDKRVHGPVSLKQSKDWPGIARAVGSNKIVAGFYDLFQTTFFLSNNTCFQFLDGHFFPPEPIADTFSSSLQKSISANKGLLTAFYDPSKYAYYFFFNNGKYIRYDSSYSSYPVKNVNSHTWPGLDHDSFTNPNYYNKIMINKGKYKFFDFVLRRAS
ncbi:hypothetical protein [Candidatus Sororendozoicomonas aggregata]|uniref:hypothetical protein n=1 Tax=Candidatus Sororendozoicomonas aggregata TaxID=3073239 RepID=UPI002ED1D60B